MPRIPRKLPWKSVDFGQESKKIQESQDTLPVHRGKMKNVSILALIDMAIWKVLKAGESDQVRFTSHVFTPCWTWAWKNAMDIVSDTKPELFYFLFGEREAAFSFFTLFMPDLHLAKQQPCKVLLWQIVGWRSSVQMYRRRFLLRADFQRQQGFQFCLLVMLQPMLGALLESANPFAQSHHSSYCAPGSLMKLYEAYIVWFTSFFHFFSVHSPSHPANSNRLSIEL